MSVIIPDWPAPARVRAAVTTRQSGNLAQHVGDDPRCVEENRRRLEEQLQLPREPSWLNQVHGTQVVQAPFTGVPTADAAYAKVPQVVCAVLTADCLPVLFCDEQAAVVGIAHAGWRGLAAGVLQATVTAMAVAPQRLLAWLGPAIGPTAFEVGAEVRQAFIAQDSDAAACFAATADPGKFLADLYALARRRLRAAGVERIYGGGRCTYTEAGAFFSYRRDRESGRMASLIWLAP